MKFLTAIVFLVVSFLCPVLSSNSDNRPKYLHGQRARNYGFLMAEYKKMVEARQSSDVFEFLEVASRAYNFDRELRKLCCQSIEEVRDLTCIDYSKLRRKIYQICTRMFHPVLDLLKNDLSEIIETQVQVNERLESVRELNAEISLVISNIRQFPNTSDPGIWIQAALYNLHEATRIIEESEDMIYDAEKLSELCALYLNYYEMTMDQINELKNWDYRLERQKDKLALMTHFLVLEKEKNVVVLSDLYKLKNKR